MEAKTKKLLIGLGIGALAITGAILAWNKWGKKKPPVKEKEVEQEEEKKKEAESKGQTYTPPKNNDTFPLDKGKRGNNVKALQVALNDHFSANLSPDGAFGNLTKGKVEEIGYKVPVSESDFNRILEGKYSASKGTIADNTPKQDYTLKRGKLAYSKYGGTPIYKYGTGKLERYASKGEVLGTVSDIQSNVVAFGKDEFDKNVFVKNTDYAYVLS